MYTYERCRLTDLVHELSASPPAVMALPEFPLVGGLSGSHITTMTRIADGYSAPLVARAHLRLGLWTWALNVTLPPLLNSFILIMLPVICPVIENYRRGSSLAVVCRYSSTQHYRFMYGHVLG